MEKAEEWIKLRDRTRKEFGPKVAKPRLLILIIGYGD